MKREIYVRVRVTVEGKNRIGQIIGSNCDGTFRVEVFIDKGIWVGNFEPKDVEPC